LAIRPEKRFSAQFRVRRGWPGLRKRELVVEAAAQSNRSTVLKSRPGAAAVKRHLADYERAAKKLDQLRARVAAAEAAIAEPLCELGKLVGRERAAKLAGVDVRIVNRAYKKAKGEKDGNGAAGDGP
jgi:hypothetical protein